MKKKNDKAKRPAARTARAPSKAPAKGGAKAPSARKRPTTGARPATSRFGAPGGSDDGRRPPKRASAGTGPARRDDRPARAERSDRPMRTERSDRPMRTERSDRPMRTERSDRPTRDFRAQRSEAPQRAGRGEGAERGDRFTRTERAPRTERPARAERPARIERSARPERTDRPARAERSERPARAERPTRPGERAARPDRRPAPLLVWGRRPVEALLGELAVKAVTGLKQGYALHLLGDEKGKVPAQLKDIVEQAKALGLKTRVALGHEDETWPLSSEEGLNHQRVCLEVPELPTSDIHALCAEVRAAVESGVKGCLGVVLDQVQDPRNFGSILRSAAFFGNRFAVYGEDRQAPISSTVIKASAGGAFTLKLAPVVNINRALAQLKEAGAWIVGSALSDTAVAPETVPLDRPYVLVLGNEAKGIRQDVARNCDYVVRIPGGNPAVDSLNVGVAAGLLLGRLGSAMVPD